MSYRQWTALIAATGLIAFAAGCNDHNNKNTSASNDSSDTTATPIQHVVVIFQENVSFDHYFGTYPYATNPSGEPQFTAASDTPTDIDNYTLELLNNNPNLNPANGSGASNPFRLDRSQALTADQDHNYEPEQIAFNNGDMDLFPSSVGKGGPPPDVQNATATQNTGLTMGYYDGNTVTALWNYAQRYAMSDNSYDTNFGPSSPGAINLVSGQTNGIIQMSPADNTYGYVADGNGGKTLIGDPDPLGDVCSGNTQVRMGGRNIGDMLNKAGVTWGWFEGGFDLTVTNSDGTTGCDRSHQTSVSTTGKNTNGPVTSADYIPHHEPFQYYSSTANLDHKRPFNVASIGHTYEVDSNGKKTDTKDPANHQYDSHDFFDAVKAGNFPAVNFLKAPAYQDGHAGYSDPIDEQDFIVKVVNFLQQQGEWKHTAVIVAYDDSDGWYDHRYSPNVNPSASMQDALNGTGTCNAGGKDSVQRSQPLDGIDGKPAQGRCGYGPRLPLLVISPWAKQNFVDHTVTDQTSVMRFIEDNWLGGQRLGQGSFDKIAGSLDNMFDFGASSAPNASTLLLDPNTGEPKSS
ncbi:phospholipase C [Salinisphaera hydrothermalis]|uniref:phospholipase C n=1 Tax=Salinisphaera hydrothermalis TaxID=563188 RepID=UPI00056C1F31|nr:alkaline phosphatase family protein [Salinisphaera hydrothermalis]